MWDPIKWFVYRGSWRPLSALCKNSPPNPGAGYSWDRGQSQFSFSLRCLRSPLSAQSHQVAHTSFSHDTRSSKPGGVTRRVSEWSKVGDKSARVCLRAGKGTYSSGCVHAYTQLATLCNGVTPFDKSIKEVFLSPLTHPLPAAACQTKVLAGMCPSFLCTERSKLRLNSKSVLDLTITPTSGPVFCFHFNCVAWLTAVKHWPLFTVIGNHGALSYTTVTVVSEECVGSRCVPDPFNALLPKPFDFPPP